MEDTMGEEEGAEVLEARVEELVLGGGVEDVEGGGGGVDEVEGAT